LQQSLHVSEVNHDIPEKLQLDMHLSQWLTLSSQYRSLTVGTDSSVQIMAERK
jgi:hypothetical protein